jgi:hypothetical protein
MGTQPGRTQIFMVHRNSGAATRHSWRITGARSRAPAPRRSGSKRGDPVKLLSSTEFASQLDWTRQALSRALTSNRVFYVDFKGDRYFPAFYAEPNYQRSHLEAVTKVLGDLHGGAKLQFFLNGKGSLGGATPLEHLAQGKLQKVKDVAAAFADVR